MRELLHSHEFLYQILIAFLFTVQCNMFAYWYIPVESAAEQLICITAGFLLFYICLLLFSFIKILYAFFLITVFTCSGAITFFMLSNETPVSENMLVMLHSLTLQSFNEYAAPAFFLWTLLLLSEAVILVYNHIKLISDNAIYRLKDATRLKIIAALLMLLAALAACMPLRIIRDFLERDLSCSFFVSMYRYGKSIDYINSHLSMPAIPCKDAALDRQNQNITVVLILGNSFGLSHFKVYGYKENTTPILKDTDAVFFSNVKVSSPYPRWTAVGALTRDADPVLKKDASEKSIIAFLRGIGFFTCWISNHRFISEKHTTPLTAMALEAEATYFYERLSADKKQTVRLDEALLPEFDARLKSATGPKFIVLHTIGSALPCDYHYPKSFRFFTPTVSDEDPLVAYETAASNSYDNSILYTDYIVSEIIFKLSKMNALVFYISLSKDMTAPNDGRVPLIVWASNEYRDANQAAYKKLSANAKKSVTQSAIFHSILDGAGIRTEIIDPDQSLFR